jgi:hypothetical protein
VSPLDDGLTPRVKFRDVCTCGIDGKNGPVVALTQYYSGFPFGCAHAVAYHAHPTGKQGARAVSRDIKLDRKIPHQV